MSNLLTARGLAERLSVSPSTVLDWWQANKIPGYRFGRAVRFDLDEILALGRKGSGAGGGVSATPTASPTRAVVSLSSATPNRGGEDA